jgi:hypothetical protein
LIKIKSQHLFAISISSKLWSPWWPIPVTVQPLKLTVRKPLLTAFNPMFMREFDDFDHVISFPELPKRKESTQQTAVTEA